MHLKKKFFSFTQLAFIKVLRNNTSVSFSFYHISAVRQEAIKVALIKRKEEEGLQPGLPAPTKRQSFVTRRNTDPSSTGSGKRNSSYSAPPTSFKGINF